MTVELKEVVAGTDYERIFHPQSLAIIGVSAEGYGFGSGMLKSLLSIGYEGKIFPVNPKGGEIAGLKIYKSVEDIPDRIDFGVVAVAAPLVVRALEDCRRKDAAGAEVLSSGFKELGTPEGKALEEDLKKAAQKDFRIVGPNCFGIYCPRSGLTILPGAEFPRESGPIAFLAQSGGMTNDFINIGKWLGLRYSKVVSFGNGVDLRETELLQYLGDDPETKVICMYIEGIEDGDAFFSALQQVTARKPVIIYKGGLSPAGQRAVASHTASMGGSKAIWDAILHQANVVRVSSTWEMAQASLAFAMLPERSYQGITVAGGGGALGVAACDEAEENGIELPQLKSEIQEKIMAILPKPGSSAMNPVDCANPGVPPFILKDVLLHAAAEERVGLQILIQLLYVYKAFQRRENMQSLREATPYIELADMMADVQRQTGKPAILVLPNNRQNLDDLDLEEVRREAWRLFIQNNVLCFENLTEAFRAIGQVSRYYRRREEILGN
ncbi:MAG: CoA-binding protein [Deltaproteobacteria bacterium]|nr:CoA-binding protein [Deltaproteobacteria bacterium]